GDRYRFVDDHGAEVARIHDGDLPARDGLVQRALEGSAWQIPRARVGVAAGARHKRLDQLRVRGTNGKEAGQDQAEQDWQQSRVAHGIAPAVVSRESWRRRPARTGARLYDLCQGGSKRFGACRGPWSSLFALLIGDQSGR